MRAPGAPACVPPWCREPFSPPASSWWHRGTTTGFASLALPTSYGELYWSTHVKHRLGTARRWPLRPPAQWYKPGYLPSSCPLAMLLRPRNALRTRVSAAKRLPLRASAAVGLRAPLSAFQSACPLSRLRTGGTSWSRTPHCWCAAGGAAAPAPAAAGRAPTQWAGARRCCRWLRR